MMAMLWCQQIILGKKTFSQVPVKLKDQVREKLDATAKDLYGVENFTDMIADETVCTDDLEALLNFLAENGHPVLEMTNIAELM